MSTLPDTFMYGRPVQYRVTVLDSDNDIPNFSRTTDNYPDSNGMYRRRRKDFIRDDIQHGVVLNRREPSPAAPDDTAHPPVPLTV